LSLLADACHRAGRSDEGLRAIDEAMTYSRTNNERWWDAELHRLRAELLFSSGADAAEAEAAYARSRQIARAQRARSLELRTVTSLARLWQRQGRSVEARALLVESEEAIGEGQTPDQSAARKLLQELS
jgi:adenylate cyclase